MSFICVYYNQSVFELEEPCVVCTVVRVVTMFTAPLLSQHCDGLGETFLLCSVCYSKRFVVEDK